MTLHYNILHIYTFSHQEEEGEEEEGLTTTLTTPYKPFTEATTKVTTEAALNIWHYLQTTGPLSSHCAICHTYVMKMTLGRSRISKKKKKN
jgi:hypothetical protein